MAKKSRKQIAIVLFFVFSLPLATVICCCSGEAWAAELNPHSHDQGKDHDHHGGHGQSGSSHDHGQCDHPKLIAAVYNQGIELFTPHRSSLSLCQKVLSSIRAIPIVPSPSGLPPREHGPPKGSLFSAPLYLRIAVLRI